MNVMLSNYNSIRTKNLKDDLEAAVCKKKVELNCCLKRKTKASNSPQKQYNALYNKAFSKKEIADIDDGTRDDHG